MIFSDAMEDEISILDTPALRPDQIVKLQEKTQAFIQSLTEHKPLLDKLNKTGDYILIHVLTDNINTVLPATTLVIDKMDT